jgi:hypothetical protein
MRWQRAVSISVVIVAASTAAAWADTVEVTGFQANLRSSPSRTGEVLATLPRGTQGEFLGKVGVWFHVRVVSSGQVGYLHSSLATLVAGPPAATPGAAPPYPQLPPAAYPAPAPAAALPPPPVESVPEPGFSEVAPVVSSPETLPPAPPPPSAELRSATGNQEGGSNDLLFFGSATTTRTSFDVVDPVTGALESSSSTSTMGSLFFNYGRFLSRRVEIGGGPTVTFGEGADGGTSTQFGGNLFFRFYFPTEGGVWYPFVGADVFVSDFSPGSDLPASSVPGVTVEGPRVIDATFGQLIGGAKVYVNEHLALDLRASFGVSLGDPGNVQSFQAIFGFSYVF